MAQKTTSDQLKSLLAQYGCGAEKFWKRLSKKKNEAQQWVRLFENTQNGARVEVVELGDGKFMARSLEGQKNLTLSASRSFTKKEKSSPVETDPAKNKAADQVIKKLLAFDADGDGPGYVERNDPLLKKAGKALANRFTFAVTDEDDSYGSFYAIITPTEYWKKEKCCYDQGSPLDHLLPGAEDVNECGTWVFESKVYASASELVDDLRARGFIWDKKFQDFIDPSVTNKIQQKKPSLAAHVHKPRIS